MKNSAFLFLILCCCGLLHAQNEFGPKLNIGVSMLHVHLESSYYDGDTEENFPLVSGHCGLFFNHHFANRSLFGAELLFMPIQGRQHIKIMFTDSIGNATGDYGESQLYRHALYASLPVYFGLCFNNTSIVFGPQIGYCFASGGREEGTIIYQGDTSEYINTADMLAIDEYHFGVNVGAIYKLSERFSLNAAAYCGVNNLLEDERFSQYWKWRAFQFTVGIRWNILANTETLKD